jgi:site-specific DNA recombinase
MEKESTIRGILTNEKYKGDALLQKTYTVDFLTKKRAENNGEVPQYYVEESHPVMQQQWITLLML